MIKSIFEVFKFIAIRKKFWLFPLVLLILILSTLFIFAEGSAIAPFIYTFF